MFRLCGRVPLQTSWCPSRWKVVTWIRTTGDWSPGLRDRVHSHLPACAPRIRTRSWLPEQRRATRMGGQPP